MVNIHAIEGVNYAPEDQGVATQVTDKGTGVTLNKLAGQITMTDANLASLTNVTFTLTNSLISPKDIVLLNIVAGATEGAYDCWVSSLSASTCTITLRNLSANDLAEAVVIEFGIVHGKT